MVRLLSDQTKYSLGQHSYVAWMQIKLHVDPENMQMHNWQLNVPCQATMGAQHHGLLEQGDLLPQ